MANTQVPFDKLKLASAEIFFAILKRREWEVGTTITTGVLQQLRSGVQGKFAAPTGIGKSDPVSAFTHAWVEDKETLDFAIARAERENFSA